MSNKWRIERNSDLSITVQKVGIGGYAALESGPSGIAESILFHLANDLLSERNASQPVATSTRLPTEVGADQFSDKSEQHAAQSCEIGIYGKHWDGPSVTRAYTYQHQPHNVEASRIGGAVYKARSATVGDHIDLGLVLLRELQEAGFGVFELCANLKRPPAPGEEG